MAGTRTLRALAQAPYEGAFGGVDGGGACECASRVAAGHAADAHGGGSMEAGADDNAPYDFRKLFKEAGHKGSLSGRPFRFPFNYGIVTMRGKEPDQLRQSAAILHPNHVAQNRPSHL